MSRDFTRKQVLTAIKGSGAIMSTVARRLDCEWTTAKRYVNKWEKTRIAFESEDNTVLDLAESVLYQSIKDGNTQDAKWLLAKRRRNKYADRQEIEHDGGVTIQMDWGDRVTTDD